MNTQSESEVMTQGELTLATMFKELIGAQDIGRDDNFFDLGGTSLLALRLIRRVEHSTGVRMNLIQLATGTIGSLARELPQDFDLATPPPGIGSRLRRLFGRPNA